MRTKKKSNNGKKSERNRINRGTSFRTKKHPDVIKRPVIRERTDVVVRLLYILALFSIAFFGINAHWPWLRHIDVRGAGIYSSEEIISLAALDDCPDIWAFALPIDKIADAIEKDPYIEQADISHTGLNSIRINITERRPVAAVNQNGYRFVFDRTGELLEILRPDETCLVSEVKNVPLGLLKRNGEPYYKTETAWRLPEGSADPGIMELQFNRLIQLRFLLDRYTPDRDESLRELSMDNEGRLTVEYMDCAPILLGNFDSPEIQIRNLTAALDNELLINPERTVMIDLSSVLFPCYHVREKYLTLQERSFIEDINLDQVDTTTELVPVTVFDDPEGSDEASVSTDAESVEGDTWVDEDEEDEVAIIGNGIFRLGGE